MPTNSAAVVKCPDSEKSLLQGSFPAFLRELVVGSSRRDLLSAIRCATVGNWELSPGTGTVTLTTATVRAVFDPKASDSGAWVRAETPHGELSLPRSHWIARQIQSRAERRLTADRLALAQQGPKCLDELLQSAQGGDPRVWVPEKWEDCIPIDLSFFTRRRSFSTQLSDGYRATITNNINGGFDPRSGSWTWLVTEISIQHDRLNELRKAFGMDPTVLYREAAEVWDNESNRKFAMFYSVFKAARDAAESDKKMLGR